jgi:hypothetical protein
MGTKGSKLYGERLFMRNGSVFTARYMEAKLTRPGSPLATWEYLGPKGVLLGYVLESEIIARVYMAVPAMVRVPKKDAATGWEEVPIEAGIDVSGYKF